MKKIFTLLMIVLMAASMMAQAPEKFSYQSVVRNSNNQLVVNAPIGVRVSILVGGTTGSPIYVENHSATTNASGLMTLQIGGGFSEVGQFSNIHWGNDSYYIKIEVDPNGGTNYTLTSIQQLLSVPYALYAKEAGNSFSGDYNDLTNRPQIPQIPANVSAFNNDAGYVTNAAIPTVPTNVSAFVNDAGYLTNVNVPNIPTNVSAFANDAGYITASNVPTNVSQLLNDAGYLTTFTESQVLSIHGDTIFLTGGSFVKLPNSFDGNYNSLTNKPAFANVATSGNYYDLQNRPNLAPVATSGSYTDLINKPTFSRVALSGNYDDLWNRPVVPTVPTNVSAFHNDAHYITSAAIPTNVSAFNNDAQYITSAAVPTNVSAFNNDAQYITSAAIPTNVSAFNNDAGYLTSFTESQILSIQGDTIFLTGGSFVKLPAMPNRLSQFENDAHFVTEFNVHEAANIPTNVSSFINDAQYITSADIPTNVSAFNNDAQYITNAAIPTNVSAFTNDAGYLTSYTESQVLRISNDTIFLTGGSFVKLPAGFDGNYNSLTNKPEIPTIPTNVSAFNNDAGYLTSYTESQILSIHGDTIFLTGGSFVKLPASFDGNYNSLTNKPVIPTVPTTVSSFTNDAGYITQANVPSNVSAYANDAHYTNNASCEEVQFCDLVAQLDRMQHEINSLRLRMGDTLLPEVTTATISGIDEDMAICGGDVTSDGNAAILTRGVCWNTNPNPTITLGGRTNDGQGAGAFTSMMTGLTPSTTYYVRAFAVNVKGVAYGEEFSFTTKAEKIIIPADNSCPEAKTAVDYDGNVYNTIQIGTQCWLKENVRTTHYPNGTPIPVGESAELYDGYDYASLMFYPSDRSLVPTNGLFYNPVAITNIGCERPYTAGIEQGICPNGWHLPSAGDWNTLINYLGEWDTLRCNNEASNVAKALASQTGWNSSNSECTVGYKPKRNNASGFNAYPAGYFATVSGDSTLTVASLGSKAVFFIGGNQSMPFPKPVKVLDANGSTFSTENYDVFYGVSVRCILNNEKSTILTDIPFIVVTTDEAITSIASTSAICGGDVKYSGRDNPSARGICWSTSHNPTTSSDHVGCGSGKGAFRTPITGLTPNTTYYVRSYATGYRGTTYGAERTFTTADSSFVPTATLPTVTTGSVSDVKSKSVNCSGAVVDDGFDTVTSRGLCYGKSSNPTIDSSNHLSSGSGLGVFSITIVNLEPATTYYIRAYATNAIGTAYGNEMVFTTDSAQGFNCGKATVTDVDDNVYNTVEIGEQCWMKENLKTTHYADGSPITLSTATTETGKYYFYPNNKAANVADRGLLYTFKAIMNDESTSYSNPSGVQGVCPDGWHVPSSTEWTALINYVKADPAYICNGVANNYAKALADNVFWSTSTTTCAIGNDLSTNNATGLSLRPAGLSNRQYSYMLEAYYGTCSYQRLPVVSGYQERVGFPHSIAFSTTSATQFTPSFTIRENLGMSVRCLKDPEN